MRKEILYLIMTAIGGLILLGTTVYTCIMWQQAPDQIPLHFDFSGNVTDYGGKGSMVLLLAIAWIAFIGMTILVKFPKTWNMPVKVTAENAERLYSITRGMLEVLKFVMVLLMASIVITTISGTGFSGTIIMVLTVVMLLVIGLGMFMLYRNK